MVVWTGNKFPKGRHRETQWHSHRCVQIFCIQSGMLNLKTKGSSWIIPAGRLAWINANVEHAAITLSPITGWSVYGDMHPNLGLDVAVLRSTPLLETLLERVAELGKLNTRQQFDKSVIALIQSELSDIEKEPLGLFFPAAKSLRIVAERIMKDGRVGSKLPECAKMAKMSERSFSRHFRRETGISFDQWRTKAMHHRAIELIGQGESVTSTALTLGYDSVSAFIASFRREYGMSPIKFLKRRIQTP